MFVLLIEILFLVVCCVLFEVFGIGVCVFGFIFIGVVVWFMVFVIFVVKRIFVVCEMCLFCLYW